MNFIHVSVHISHDLNMSPEIQEDNIQLINSIKNILHNRTDYITGQKDDASNDNLFIEY